MRLEETSPEGGGRGRGGTSMDSTFQLGRVAWGKELGLGKHLPVPLGYSVTVHCSPKLQEPTNHLGSQKIQLGCGLDASRNPQIPTTAPWHMQFPLLFLSFLSHCLSPSRPIISRPNSSRKPSRITGAYSEPPALKFPTCCLLGCSAAS